jgi:hypothetical protein
MKGFYLISYGITNLHYFFTYWDMYGPHHNQQEKTMWISNLTLNPINIATTHHVNTQLVFTKTSPQPMSTKH